MSAPPPVPPLSRPELPLRPVAAGTTLLQEGVPTDELYMLATGSFEVVRGGVRVVVIDEPGAFLGEIAALLGSSPTASVVALRDSSVRVIAQAAHAVRGDPELTYAIARLLARRLHALTAYLVDIKRQYGDSENHLGLMDQVLARLMTLQAGSTPPGSERRDVPDY